MIGQHQYRSPEPDPSGGGGQVRQRGQGMIVWLIIESLADIPVVKQMIHDPDGVVTQRLSQWPHSQDLLRIFDAPVIWNGHTEFHRVLLSSVAMRPTMSLAKSSSLQKAQCLAG